MRKLSLLAVVLGLVACRDSGGGDDQPGIDSNTTGNDVKIQDIQDPAMTNGTAVTVKGVVVTAIDAYGSKTGDFWIQEPEGGEFSGIHVFGAPLDQVAALAVGDIVDITGAEKDDFMYSDFDPGFAITELKPVSGGVMTVTKTGSNMVLQPQLVDALMIGGLPSYEERAAEWEKWEGVLIRIENVTASENQDCVGTACNDPTLQKMQVTGDVVLESALAPFPVDSETNFAEAWKRGTCITGATGVLDYFFDYLLLPRTTDEYGTVGTSCPTENTAQACSDGMDNDGNGFMDCDDNACIVASASCRTVYTIDQLQPSSTAITGGVEIQNARVVAVSNNKQNMWVQIDVAAAANEGIYIRGNSSLDLSTFDHGDRVTIIGKALEFNNDMTGDTLTQVQAYSVTAGTGSTTTPTPLANQSVASLLMPANAEPVEGVFIELQNVKVTAVGGANGIATMSQAGGAVFKADDDNINLKTNNVCYSSIRGIWSYNVFSNEWLFLPRRKTSAPNSSTTDDVDLDAVVATNATDCN